MNYTLAKHHRFALTVNNVLDEEFVDWVETTSRGKTSYTNQYRDYLYGRNFWFSYNYNF